MPSARFSTRISRALPFALALLSSLTGCSTDDVVGPHSNQNPSEQYPVSRNEAVAAARAAYVDAAAAEHFVIAAMGDAPYAAGSRLDELRPAGEPGRATVLSEAAYLAVVDKLPSGGLPHPFTYLLIDAHTGVVTEREAFYPPAVDGAPVLATPESRIDPQFRFEPLDLNSQHAPEMDGVYTFESDPFANAGAAAAPPVSYAQAHPEGEQGADVGGRRISISISGGNEDAFENTTSAFNDRMRNMGFETEKLSSKDYPLEDLKQRVRDLTAGLGEGDKVVLYLFIHSYIDDENNDGELDGPPRRVAYDLGGANNTAWALFTSGNGSVSDLLNDIPAEHVNFVMVTCGGGGALIRYMSRPAVGAPFQPYPGSTVRVYASSNYDRVSKFGKTDNSGESRIDRYTSRLLDYWSGHPMDTNGDGELSVDEIEHSFDAAHEHARQTFSSGDVFDFDQKTPPVGTFTGATLEIDRPVAGSVYDAGEVIVFQGHALEANQTSVQPFNMWWTSSIDGNIGVGPAIARNDLSPGTHTITFSAIFAAGQTVTRTTTITVGVGGIPQVAITSPLGGTFRRGDPIEFSGTASDPEDGEPSVLWISDIDGDIGSGTSFVRTNLSEGTHTITMEARDSEGNYARVTTQITVLTGVPVAHIATPEDGATLPQGIPFSFVGSALDPEDGVIASDDQLVWHSSIDGEICKGTGCLKTLSAGTHVITLTATDADGNTGEAKITVTVTAELADLHGTVSPRQSQVVVGEAFALDVSVHNTGGASAPAGWQLRAYLSTDQTFDAGDCEVAVLEGPAVSSAGAENLVVEGTIPADLPPGNYWWIIRLDPTDQVEESDETNNEPVADQAVSVMAVPLFSAEPSSFQHYHFVALSPCPDAVGTLVLSNPRDVPITISLGWSLANEISFSDEEVTIAPGGSAEVQVLFTCATTTSFQGNIVLTGESAEGAQQISVPVAVQIEHEGLLLAHDTGPFPAGTFITLSRISGGGIGEPEAGCAERHIHGAILIDGMGPFPDPNPSGCGHGVVTYQEN